MSRHRDYPAPAPLLIGYDPYHDLPLDHLARFVDLVVEESVAVRPKAVGKGQPQFDPRLLLKVLLYGYATGIRSSRTMERLCGESLGFLYLTRGDTPGYHTLSDARVAYKDTLEEVWVSMFAMAGQLGMSRLGRIVVDSTKLRADASMESVVRRVEYEAVLSEFEGILAEAASVDGREAEEDCAVQTRTGQVVEPDQMRDILRRVRAQRRMAKRPEGEEESASPKPLNGGQPKLRGQVSARMLARVEQARDAVKEAQAEGRKHVSVTDPDARMMPEGCQKSVRECHSFGVAMDSGLIVGSETTAEASDAKRLVPLLERATEQEPLGVWALDADSGYYSGEIVGRLLEAGLDTCIPDSNTAGDVHRSRPIGATRDAGRGKVVFAYDADADCYRCPPGNTLVRQSRRMDYGQMVTTYRAKSDCRGCPLAWECLTQPQAKHRTLKVGDRHDLLEAARKRFSEPEHRARYRQRGPAVETVFGYLRAVLGYSRWLLRGDERVGAESTLFKVAYQTRKLHRRWAAAL